MEDKLNVRLLRSEMVLHGDTNKKLSEYLGLHPSSLADKINENKGRCFDRKELVEIKKRYGLTNEQFIDIFFGDSVHNQEILES